LSLSKERLATLQAVLERKTERATLLLRKLLGPIRLDPVEPEVGRPYYRAVSALDALAILEEDPEGGPSEPGSNSLRKWRRGESNPRPKAIHRGVYVRSLAFCSRPGDSRGRDAPEPARAVFVPGLRALAGAYPDLLRLIRPYGPGSVRRWCA